MKLTHEEKVVVVTGANRGLGRVIALGLAQKGVRLVMGCRSMEQAAKTRAMIMEKSGNAKIEAMPLDLADRQSVLNFAEVFSSRYEALHVLVNNAGISTKQRQLSKDGVELTWMTNVLGPHFLTDKLMPSLKAGTPARVVNVASEFAGRLDLSDLSFENRPWSGTDAYKQSKQANRMLTRAWARRLDGSGVTVNSMGPGLMMTDLFRDASIPMKFFLRILHLFVGMSVDKGADTATWLAGDPSVRGQSGGFYVNRKLVPCQFDDYDLEESLWEHCAEMLYSTSQ